MMKFALYVVFGAENDLKSTYEKLCTFTGTACAVETSAGGVGRSRLTLGVSVTESILGKARHTAVLNTVSNTQSIKFIA